MTEKTEKKPYSPPQIFEVELNQEQAILALCSTNTTGLSNSGTVGCSSTNSCRRFTGSGGSGAQPS